MIGGKGTAYPQILSRMPEHTHYLEMFLGMGAVLRHKRPVRLSVAFERDQERIALFQTAFPYLDCSIVCTDALSCPLRVSPGWLVYADPPYVLSTRSRAYYRYEMTDSQHVQLIERLTAFVDAGADVMLSGYPSQLYDAHVPSSWSVTEFSTATRAGSAREILWTSFDPVTTPKADYTRVGSNFTDRQRIKRKVTRWTSNLQAMAPDERGAILDAIRKCWPA